MVKNWGIESNNKILYSEVQFPKNAKKVIILINSAKNLLEIDFFLIKNLKSAYQKIVSYLVLCQLINNWGFGSIGKRLSECIANASRKPRETTQNFPTTCYGEMIKMEEHTLAIMKKINGDYYKVALLSRDNHCKS